MLTFLTLVACTGEDPGIKALQPDIVVTPEVLDFGQVVEAYSGSGTVEIINAGQGALKLDEVSLSGDTDVFVLGAATDEIPGDSRFPLPITFLPQAPLPYTATLTIHSNDPDQDVLSVTLTGEGIVAPTPDIACDPLSLDFGTVAAGALSTLWTTCTNVGDDDLYIDSWTMTGSGSFQLVSDPTGYLLPPDQSVQLIVVYAPNSDTGDNAAITLNTNDPDEPTTTLTLVGNGGGDFEYPVAVLDCPGTAEPRTTITVDGGDSYDPTGYEPLTYLWTVTGPYSDVETTERGTELYVQLDLAGTYVVQLQVQNAIGLKSAPAMCITEAIPTEEFHVELVWDELPDMDLHLLTSDGALFTNPYDCNYCNPNPDWGVALEGADDPTLDLDAYSTPPGVENINIESPADDNYFVRVHYYEDNGGGDTAVTVNIYLYGTLEGSFTRVLQRNNVWDVAQVIWPEGYVVEEETDLYTPTLRTCQ